MKKVLVILLALTVSAALFAGGGGQAAPSGGGAAPAQVKEIRVLLANHPYGDLLKPMLPEFERQSGIRINMEQLNETQLTQKLTTEFASGAASVDVFMTRPLQEALLFLKNGWYAPLNSYDFSDYPPAAVDLGRRNGNPYIVPLINEWHVVYYRKDLLEKAGVKVPTTLAELEEAAKVLNTGGISGIALRGAASPAVTQLSSFLYNYGTNFLKDNVAIFDNPDAIEAVRVYGRLNGAYGPPGVESMSWDQLMPVFQAGRIAMFVDASTFLGQLVDPSQSTVTADQVGVAPFPAGPKGNSCYLAVAWAMGVSSKTRDMDSAMKFLNWATDKEKATQGMDRGIAVARSSVWNDPAITSKLNPGLVASRDYAAKNGIPYDRPVMTSVVQARDYIGELITESILTKGTSTRLPALATEKVNQVNDLLKADGEYGSN